MVDSSDKMWSIGEENGKPLQHSCLENSMNSMKRQKDMTLEDDLLMLAYCSGLDLSLYVADTDVSVGNAGASPWPQPLDSVPPPMVPRVHPEL